MTMYGVYDKQDGLWIGTDDGPNLYEDRAIARVAAMALEDMIHGGRGWLCRFEAKEFNVTSVRLRDRVEAKRTGEESLRRLENE